MVVCALGFLALIFFKIVSSVKDLPHIESRFTKRFFATENEAIDLPCPICCANCTLKTNILWRKDGKLLDTKFNATSTLSIKNYTHGIHNGTYVCILKVGSYIQRSIPVYLDLLRIPEYTVNTVLTEPRKTVLLHCVESTLLLDAVVVHWYKGDDKMPLVNSEDKFVWDQFLCIVNVQHHHAGSYRCVVNVKRTESVISIGKSGEFHVVVQGDNSEFDEKYPFISYFTPTRDIEVGATFSIVCLSSHHGNTMIRLYKIEDDGRKNNTETKIFERNGALLVYTIESFQISDADMYVCKIFSGHVRSRKETVFNFLNSPVILNKNFTHYNQMSNRSVEFYCNVAASYPVPSVKWYYNGEQLLQSNFRAHGRITETSLLISNPDVTDRGGYQCIVENTVGSDAKYFYLTIGNSNSAPTSLTVKVISSSQVRLSWSHSSNATNATNSYRVSWCVEIIDSCNIYTKNNSVMVTAERGLRAGKSYGFVVCLLKSIVDLSDCTSQYYVTIPESAPLVGPELLKPEQHDNQTHHISWNDIPDSLTMGVITNYTIYCQELTIDHNQLKSYTVSPRTGFYVLTLRRNSVYKVWMTAKNRAGKSPESRSYTIHTISLEDEMHKNVDVSISAKWLKDKNGNLTAEIKWRTEEVWSGYRLFYVQVPYRNFYSQLKSTSLKPHVRQVRINDLSPSASYRFMIAPMYTHTSPNAFCKSDRLGQTATVHLLPDVQSPRNKIPQNALDNNSKPRDLTCTGFHRVLFIDWDSPHHVSVDKLMRYYVEIFKDSDGDIKTTYVVSDATSLYLPNVDAEHWYRVRVGLHTDDYTSMSYTEFMMCATKQEVPSKPLNLTYAVIYSKQDQGVYLRLHWQRPEYPGRNTFSYIIQRQIRPVSTKPLLTTGYFSMCEYSLIENGNTFEDLLMLPEIKTEGNNVMHHVEISAVNNAGTSQVASLDISVSNIPDEWMKKNSPWEINNNNITHNRNLHGGDANDLITVIVVGILISAFFLAIFLGLCIVKKPCKKFPTARSSSSSLLYYVDTDLLCDVQNANDVTTCKTTIRSNISKLRWRSVLWFGRSFQPSSESHSESTDEAMCSLSSGSSRPQLVANYDDGIESQSTSSFV